MLHETNCGVCATQHSIPCVQLNVQQWLAFTSHHKIVENEFIMPMPQIFSYLCKFFMLSVVSFELILPSGIRLYTTRVTQQCNIGITRPEYMKPNFLVAVQQQCCLTSVSEANTSQLIPVTIIIDRCLEYN